MFEKHSTKLMSYNNSQPSSTTTVVDNKPANTPIEPLVDNNKLHNAQLQSVSNASADIVQGENAGSENKRFFFYLL